MQILKRLAPGRLKGAVQRCGLLVVATGLSMVFTPLVVRLVAGSLLFFLHLATTLYRGTVGRATKTAFYGELTHRQ